MMLPWCHEVYRLLSREPTVGDLMDLCEESYAYLARMAPTLAALRGRHHSQLASHLDLFLDVVEQTPYTSLIRLTHLFPHPNGHAEEPNALLRVYHDARQVEVVDLHQHALPLERLFDAPGLKNRWRANLFISRWLAFCAHQGHRFPTQTSIAPERQGLCTLY